MKVLVFWQLKGEFSGQTPQGLFVWLFCTLRDTSVWGDFSWVEVCYEGIWWFWAACLAFSIFSHSHLSYPSFWDSIVVIWRLDVSFGWESSFLQWNLTIISNKGSQLFHTHLRWFFYRVFRLFQPEMVVLASPFHKAHNLKTIYHTWSYKAISSKFKAQYSMAFQSG